MHRLLTFQKFWRGQKTCCCCCQALKKTKRRPRCLSATHRTWCSQYARRCERPRHHLSRSASTLVTQFAGCASGHGIHRRERRRRHWCLPHASLSLTFSFLLQFSHYLGYSDSVTFKPLLKFVTFCWFLSEYLI